MFAESFQNQSRKRNDLNIVGRHHCVKSVRIPSFLVSIFWHLDRILTRIIQDMTFFTLCINHWFQEASDFASPVHCVKYQNFALFTSMGIMWKLYRNSREDLLLPTLVTRLKLYIILLLCILLIKCRKCFH